MVVDFDIILEDVGEFGRYQKFITYMLSIPASFMNAFGFAFVFIALTPDFWCVPNENNDPSNYLLFRNDSSLFRACQYKLINDSLDQNFSTNSSYRKCTNFVYDQSYFKSTVVTQWNLVCDQAIHPKTMMSIHSLVTLFACLINSYFQDLFGRKKAFLIVLTSHLIGGITCVFAPNFLIYAILRSFAAYSSTSTWNISYTWALEYVGPSKRTMVTMIMCVLYGVAAVGVGGLAYVCDTWIKLTLAGTVPFILLYSFAFLIDESPRWLVSRGRNLEALKTVRKMAKWEKKNLKEETIQKLLTSPVEDEEKEKYVKENEEIELNQSSIKKSTIETSAIKRNPKIQDLFRTRNLRWTTILVTYSWAANLLTYLAIAYNMENMRGNLFLTYTLQAAVEIPASIAIIFLLDRYGRIPPLSISMITCGLLLFAAVPVDMLDLSPWIIVVLTLAAKFGITLSFSVLVQLAGESYPTQLRGLGTGFSSFVGTLGATVMPYVVHSASVYKMLPMILMGTTAITSGISILALPETMGRYMPETVAEAEKGESVGWPALKNNWRRMRCWSRREYVEVKKNDIKNGNIVDKENEEL